MIRVGPSGWSYKDWWGIVYPKPKPRGFDPLVYLARYFNTIEINSSFYGPPRPATTKKWAASVQANDDFRFTAKLFQSFTHQRNAAPADERDFKDGITPLMGANRLGALLMQFPWSFRNTGENRAYVARLRNQFAEYPLVLEVRHASWAEPGILDFLEQLGIGLCNIDQPLFKKSIKPGAEATSAIGYVRLHGRNYRNWFSEKADVRERYDYLYSINELSSWVERAKVLAENTTDTYVMSNNHNIGKAVANSLEFNSLLTGEPVVAPTTLVAHYPELLPFTTL